MWFVYNGEYVVFGLFLFILGSQKGPRPKLKAVVTQVWVPTHSLKTSAVRSSFQFNSIQIPLYYVHVTLHSDVYVSVITVDYSTCTV